MVLTSFFSSFFSVTVGLNGEVVDFGEVRREEQPLAERTAVRTVDTTFPAAEAATVARAPAPADAAIATGGTTTSSASTTTLSLADRTA